MSTDSTPRTVARHRPRPQQRPRAAAAAAPFAVGLPLLGAVLDEATSGGIGRAFAVGAVLGTLLAAWVCGPAGRWWVVTAPPVLVLGLTAGAELLCHGDKYRGKALTTGAVRWAVHAFPVTAWSIGAALLVIAIRSAAERRRRLQPGE
ncbi:DUF6542 domain-containing protein [Kitasatospora sp. GAS204B]|uniref:DUF6542 domain-containing protein n=1 Tax=unclassified Kitasatospora TaxID=2633591 RepID=UPI0024772A61|nr:DUF6542 domain-containing protein [Kitasatospora sp. GAS204B]MDH6119532.1 hypothetical protein [Kitasatospora sp. GAS204B]